MEQVMTADVVSAELEETARIALFDSVEELTATAEDIAELAEVTEAEQFVTPEFAAREIEQLRAELRASWDEEVDAEEAYSWRWW